MAKGSSVHICVVATAAIFVVLLSMQPSRVEADCNQQAMITDLANAGCLGAVNQPITTSSPCCAGMQKIKTDMNPDATCMCSMMNQPAVQATGVTPQKAAEMISTCTGSQNVPSCLG